MTSHDNLKLYSLNTRGLGEKVKRRSILHWIKTNYSRNNGIVFLQETHSTKISEKLWQRDWSGQIYFSHGSCGSCGVAILFPKKLDVSVNHIINDTHGRFLLLDVTIDEQNFILINIYAPTKDKENEQIALLNDIKNVLVDYMDKIIIIGGDFNTCLNPDIDKSGGTKENVTKYSNQITEFNTEFNLIDIWRIRNPDKTRYTWRGQTRNGIVSTRLDYWLISVHMIYDLVETDIHPSIKTDHSMISLSFEIKNSLKKGRGFWKFNSDLLKETEYVHTIKALIADLKTKHADVTNKAFLWDFIKCEIRGATISFSSFRSKQRKQQKLFLINQLKFLEQKLDGGDDLKTEYEELKQELETINEYSATGHLIRSKAKWIEDGEKCTKYFLQLENRNYKTKYIKTLNLDNITIKDPHQILSAQETFYKTLYTEKEAATSCENETCSLFSSNNNTKLSQIEKDLCDKALTLKECSESLYELSNNKSPGSDGFTTEFYKFFWTDIKQYIYDSFNYSYQTGQLSLDQSQAVLTLLPKPNKDLRLLKNWRPISLLNTDYKILTKLLSNRLQNVIQTIVSEDQSGYIKNRFIGENVRTIIDLLEYTALKQNPGLMLFLDFEKAFDTVSWKFLFKTLKHFNFGDNFINWISILYNKPLACVSNNGYSTQFFEISRGIRQGCPISALLFI